MNAGDLIVRDFLILIHGLKPHHSHQEHVPQLRIFFKIAEFESWLHAAALHTNDAEEAVVGDGRAA